MRTYWSPEALLSVTGHTLEGCAAAGFLHLISTLVLVHDGTGQVTRDGKPVMKPFWELEESEVQAMCLKIQTSHQQTANTSVEEDSTRFLTKGDMPVTMVRLSIF